MSFKLRYVNQEVLREKLRIAEVFRSLPTILEVVILLVLLIFSVDQISAILHVAQHDFQLDLHVFEDAGQAYVDHAPLYGPDFPDRQGFPFIYPPVAALFFVPLTWLADKHMQVLWTLSNLAAIWAILAMAYARILPSIRAFASRADAVSKDEESGEGVDVVKARAGFFSRIPVSVAAIVLGFVSMGFALVTDPMQRLFEFGQIDILLALLVVADLLGFTPKWSRGILVGIAAGVKITPAAFALLFLARKDYLSILRSVGGLFLLAAAGFIIRPKDSLVFWTKEVFDSKRAGLPAYEGNQAISGLLRRAGVEGQLLTILTFVFFLGGAVLAYLMARKLLSNADLPPLQDLKILFLIGLCLSVFGPYTVSNHSSIVIVGIPLMIWVSLEYFISGIILYLGHYYADNYEIFPEDGHVPVDLTTLVVGNIQGELSLLALILMATLIFNTKSVPSCNSWEQDNRTTIRLGS